MAMNLFCPDRTHGASGPKRQSLSDLAKPRERASITRESTLADIKSVVKKDVERILDKHRPN